MVSSGNHESSEIITTNDTINAAVDISGIVGIIENVGAIIEAAGDVSDDAVKAIDADLGSISGIQCNATLISVPGRSEMGVQPDVLGMCRGDAEDIKRSGKAMVCAVSSTVRSTDSGVKSLDLQGNDLRSSVPCRSEYDVRPRKAVSDFGGVEFSPLRSGSENVRGVMGMSYGDIETLAKKGSVGNGFRQSDMQIKHVCGQPYRKGVPFRCPKTGIPTMESTSQVRPPPVRIKWFQTKFPVAPFESSKTQQIPRIPMSPPTKVMPCPLIYMIRRRRDQGRSYLTEMSDEPPPFWILGRGLPVSPFGWE